MRAIRACASSKPPGARAKCHSCIRTLGRAASHREGRGPGESCVTSSGARPWGSVGGGGSCSTGTGGERRAVRGELPQPLLALAGRSPPRRGDLGRGHKKIGGGPAPRTARAERADRLHPHTDARGRPVRPRPLGIGPRHACLLHPQTPFAALADPPPEAGIWNSAILGAALDLADREQVCALPVWSRPPPAPAPAPLARALHPLLAWPAAVPPCVVPGHRDPAI